MKRYTLMLVVLLVAGLLALVACGGSEETTTTASSPGGQTTVTSATSTPSDTTTSTAAPAGETILLRLPIGMPEGDPFCTLLTEMADRFNARTNGTYEIKVYPGGSLIGIPEQMDAVRTGSAEIGSIGFGIYAGADERLSITGLPFIFNNIEAMAAAQNDKMVALFDSIMSEKFNQKVLGVHQTSFNEIISTKAIQVAEDWKGTIVGAMSPTDMDFIGAMGGSGQLVDWSEDYSNLQKGVIDAVFSGSTYMKIAELYKVAPQITYMSALGFNYGITVNLDIWNAMPADIQQILREEAAAAATKANEQWVGFYMQDKADMEAAGATVYVVPADERAKWKENLVTYVDGALARYGDFGTQFMAIVDEANAANPVK
jgi:TRAP-type transport system periplasmic protein